MSWFFCWVHKQRKDLLSALYLCHRSSLLANSDPILPTPQRCLFSIDNKWVNRFYSLWSVTVPRVVHWPALTQSTAGSVGYEGQRGKQRDICYGHPPSNTLLYQKPVLPCSFAHPISLYVWVCVLNWVEMGGGGAHTSKGLFAIWPPCTEIEQKTDCELQLKQKLLQKGTFFWDKLLMLCDDRPYSIPLEVTFFKNMQIFSW